MARVANVQNSFSRGVVSSKLWDRHDLELYFSALRHGKNFVVDGRGLLEKRPGTMFIGTTKDNDEAVLIPFAYSTTQSYMLEFGENYVRPFANYGQVYDGMSISETATPFTLEESQVLSYVQNNDVMFLAHENHQQGRLIRTGLNTFTLSTFDTYDGPYLDPNTDPTQLLALSTSGSDRLLTASGTGFSPFTADMVGRWVRLRTPNTGGATNELGDEFLWDFFQITEYVSTTQVKVDSTGGDVSATMDWRLGAFYEGEWPSTVTIHNGRLVLAKGNRVYWSKPYDFNNFAPTVHENNGGATGAVRPDNAITAVIDSGLSQTGAISKVLWMIPLNFQLLIGTPSGIVTAQSSSLGDALEPDNVVIRPQDARGVSPCLPVGVADSVLFAHSTGRRLQGTYYKDNAYDRLGAQDLSLPSDTLITGALKRLAWQDYPHGLVWACMDDGNLLSLTLQPEEKVQGWMPHELGGKFVNGGRVEHPHVESLAIIPSPDGTRTDLWLIVKRTIDGSTVRYIEVLRPFWTVGDDPRNAWYLDSALRYDGNDDPTYTLALTEPAEGGPNAAWTLTLSGSGFTTASFAAQQKLSLYDGVRWHRGTIIEITDSTHMTWLPAAPNSPPGPSDGVRWFWDADNEEWIQPGEDELYDPSNASYQEPLQTSGIWQWSIAVDDFSNLDHLEGETVRGLLDGFASLEDTISSGAVTLGGEASIVTIGLPYESEGGLLPLMAGAQAGSAMQKQRPAYDMTISVLETYGLEAGTGTRNDYDRVWHHYEQTVFDPPFAEGEPPLLYSGVKRFGRDAQYEQDDPRVAWRHREPLPCIVRAVLTRQNTSDGR